MQTKLNLPLNTVNSKKPRMPNVANRVDAIVMFSTPYQLQHTNFSYEIYYRSVEYFVKS